MYGFRFAMRWAAWAALCWLVCAAMPAHAQSYAIDVQPANQAALGVAPRQITSIAFRVTNRGRNAEFEGQIDAPSGWRVVSRDASFALKEGESSVRFVSVYVPEITRAGSYAVSYTVRDRAHPEVRSTGKAAIDVQVAQKLQVTVIENADFVIAGDAYRTVFLVHNRGNASLDAATKTVSARGYKVETGAGALQLEPGASKRIEVVVTTEKATRPEQDWLTLTVKPSAGGAAQSATTSIKVIPRVSGVEQIYDTIPATATLSWMTGKPNGTRKSGWQAEFAGAGALDPSGERKIDFLLRGPDASKLSTYGLQQQYYVKYADRTFDAILGDQIYALSPLTELGFYAGGAGGAYRSGNASFAAYAAESIAGSSNPRKEAGVNASYATQSAGRWDANVLQIRRQFNGQVNGAPLALRGDAGIYSVRNQMQWLPGLATDVEAAASSGERKDGQAFRANVVDTRAPFTYNFTVIDASPYYAGYYSNQRLAAGTFQYKVGADWNVHGFLNFQRSNLDANPLSAAPDERWLGLGTDYRLASGRELSAALVYRSDVDRRQVSEFDVSHQGLRLGISQQFATLSLYATGEWGITQDRLHGNSYPTSFYVANAYWRASSAQSYGIYATYDDNTFSNTRQQPTSTIGASASFWPLPTTSVNLVASRSTGPGAASLLDFRLSHTLENRHVVAVLARYNTGINAGTEAMLTYTVPFDLPVGRKTDVATLRGRVVDAESGKGVADVVLRLDGLVAVSDSSGTYTFPSLKPGAYHLSIDRADAGAGRVPAKPMPIDVDLRAGDQTGIDIPMIHAVVLTGVVRTHEATLGGVPAARSTGAGAVAADVLVTMRNGEQVFKRATDKEGRFRLGGLAPGTWTIGVDDDGMPAGMMSERKQIVVEAAPGAQAEVEISLVPKLRSIRMQAPLKDVK
jgi:hypothetical protein